jgi:hypothetical protein
MTGEHRAPVAWRPAAVAGTAGGLLLSKAVLFAAAGWFGWWRYGLAAAFVAGAFGVVLVAWALGYAARDEEDR